MADENELLRKRFFELADKAGSYFTYTDFLGLAEQSVLFSLGHSLGKYTTLGGTDGAERVIARFGDEGELGFSEEAPIATLKIEPRSIRFAEKLTHRDYLGTLMGLGIKRETLGDIIVRDDGAYLFCLEKIKDYIINELTRVKNTEVLVRECTGEAIGELYTEQQVRITLSSIRLDAVIAKTFNLARAKAEVYFDRGLVFCEGREIKSPSFTPKENDRITVRGLGRLEIGRHLGVSKKGKEILEIKIYK